MTTFSGYDEEALDLLARMPGWTRDDYAANKPQVTEVLIDPTKAFVEAMVPVLREQVSPGLTGEPKVNGSISPLNNDVRFAKGRDLYKDHLLVWFWEGASKKTGAKLAVRIHPDGIGFGVGMPFTPDQLARWRAAIADERSGAAFAESLARLERGADSGRMGLALKKVPAPFDADHPRGELLRHKGFQVHWQEPVPKVFTSARLVGWCVKRLADRADLHRFFVDHVVEG